MGKSRNIIEEIESIKKRLGSGGFPWYLSGRLSSIQSLFKEHGSSNKELSRYFPIALIACIEAYTRLSIAQLIDSGDPYFSNAAKILGSLKLNYEILAALKGEKVSIGELVSHNLQINRLDHVSSCMSSVLGSNFIVEISNIHDRWEHEVHKKPKASILKEPEKTFADIAKTFEARHIFSHEIAHQYEMSADEVESCVESCISFLNAFSELIVEKLHPNRPLTQADINIESARIYSDKRKEMDEVLEILRERLNKNDLRKDLALLNHSQECWDKAHQSWANFSAGPREDSGTIWPCEYNSAATESVSLRIQELKTYSPLWVKNLYGS